MKRTSGLEASPSYRITIHDDGTAEYEGFISVQVEGIRKTQLSHAAVQKLIHKLQAERFFDWEEKDYVCIDLPEVEISAVLDGKTKRVIEGCQEAGGVLDLADEIDRITGVKRWVGKVWLRGFAKEK